MNKRKATLQRLRIPQFRSGRLIATPGAIQALATAGLSGRSYLSRHLAADWGEVNAEDKAANDWSLMHGERLLSAYTLPTGVRIWIITERDRSTTTILLPDEY